MATTAPSRILPLLMRVAFICNVLFMYCWLVQHSKDYLNNTDANNYIIILGWFVAPFLTLTSNLWWLFLLAKYRMATYPSWLFAANCFFSILQITKFLIIHD